MRPILIAGLFVLGWAWMATSASGSDAAPGAIPEGMMLIEEDVWYQLADEPNFHFHQARLDFLKRDTARAATDIRKASAMLKLAIGLAEGEGRKLLRASVLELTVLVEELEHGKPVSLTALNQAFSRAHLALARYNQEAAELHAKAGQFEEAGMHLRSAAHDLVHARAWAGGELSAGEAAEVVSAEKLAEELIAGTEYALEEVLKSIRDLAQKARALQGLEKVTE